MGSLTTKTGSKKLNLPAYVGQRSASFTFELIDGVTGQRLQELHPYRDSVPTLSHDTGRVIMRQISDIQFDRIDTAVLNPVRNRVRVSMQVSGQSFPLGTYVFSDSAIQQYTSGDEANAGLMDQMFIIDQQLEASIHFNGTPVYPTAIDRVLQGFPNITYKAEASSFLTIGSWTAGTNRGQVLQDLALDGDYFAPWFDNNDVLRFIRAFDPATKIPAFDLDVGSRVSREGIIRTNDLLTAPNRYVVISNGQNDDTAASAPIVGRFDIPASAPHSIQNRGFVIPQVEDRQIGSVPQAVAIAENLAQRQLVFETIELETPPDPRHDSYDVFQFDGDNWLEISWEMELIEGGTMKHVGRKAYR